MYVHVSRIIRKCAMIMRLELHEYLNELQLEVNVLNVMNVISPNALVFEFVYRSLDITKNYCCDAILKL